MNPFRCIYRFFSTMALAFAEEWRVVLHDAGVLVFFILLPLAYPVVYTLIYNPEVVEKLPIAVVDNSRTADSRQLVRDIDATQTIHVASYCANMAEARRLVDEGRVYGILEVPSDYSRAIGRGETAHATFYANMDLLLRYRAFAFTLTDVQIATIADITADRIDMAGEAAQGLGMPVQSESYMLGDTQQGFASFVMPGILVLILQQSMVLGVCLLAGTRRQRRVEQASLPATVEQASQPATPSHFAVVWGRALCYTVFYIAPAIFALHYIPAIFNLPHQGEVVDYLLFMLPMLLASAFFGQTLGALIPDRESTFIIIVVTSVFFLFLSGLTWPRYAMNTFWTILGDFVPATWGVEGFIRINSNAATLAESAHPYHWLWGLTAAYSLLAALTTRRR